MSSIQTYFASFIGYAINPLHNKIEKKLIKKCFSVKEKTKKGGDAWVSKNTYNTLSTYNLCKDKDFLPIQNFIIKEVINYCKKLKIDISKLKTKPEYGWFNIYEKYNYQEYHCHGDSMLSVVYFLKCNEKSARIFFKSPVNEMSKIYYKDAEPLTFKYVNIVPKPGLLIIFDSSLQHSVEQHMDDEPRISLAYNF